MFKMEENMTENNNLSQKKAKFTRENPPKINRRIKLIGNNKVTWSLLLVVLSVTNLILFQNCKNNNMTDTTKDKRLLQESPPDPSQATSLTSYKRGSIAFVDESGEVNRDELFTEGSDLKMELLHVHPEANKFRWTIKRGFEVIVDEENSNEPVYQYLFSDPGVYNVHATAFSVDINNADSKVNQKSSSLTETILTNFSKRVVIGEHCSSEDILDFELQSGSLTLGQSATFAIHNSNLFTSVEWKITPSSQEVFTAEGPTALYDIPSLDDSDTASSLIRIEVTANPVDPQQSHCLNYRERIFEVSREERVHFNPSVLMDNNGQLVTVSLENNNIYKYHRPSTAQYISTDVVSADSCTFEIEGSQNTPSTSIACENGRVNIPLPAKSECQAFKTTLTAVKGATSQEQVYYNYCGKDEETCFFGPEDRRLSHHICQSSHAQAGADQLINQVSHAVRGGPPQCGSEAKTCAVGRPGELEGWLLRYYNTVRYHVWTCLADGYGTLKFCQKRIPFVNGQCGTSYLQCVTGNPMGIIQGKQWGCQGSGGGRTAICTMPDSKCGSTHNTCAAGTFRDLPDTDSQCRWMCVGDTGRLCAEPLTVVNGQCGAVKNECQAGQFRDVDDTDSHYKWQCQGGPHGGTTADCEEARPVRSRSVQGTITASQRPVPRLDGVCDTSQQNGCTAGVANDEIIPDTNTHYKWQCLGQAGGEHANCEKERTRADGKCGTYNKCLAGDFHDRNDSNRFYRWFCRGINGGQTAICRESKAGTTKSSAQSPVTGTLVHGACSSTLNECRSGQFVDRADTHRKHRWLCMGSNHNDARTRACALAKTAQAQAQPPSSPSPQATTQQPARVVRKVHGHCGSSLNTCLSGTKFRDRRDSRRYYRWYCDGTGGGRTRACRVSKQNNQRQQAQSQQRQQQRQRQPATQRVHGRCGSKLNTCLSGTSFRDRRDSRRYYRWYCDGTGGGRTRACRVRR